MTTSTSKEPAISDYCHLELLLRDFATFALLMLLYLTIFDFKAKHIFQATNYNYLASHKGQADCSDGCTRRRTLQLTNN